jgi:putative membrane protein
LHLDRLTQGFSHYDGLALIVVGIAILLISLLRFVRTTKLIDDQQSHSAASVRAELILSVVLTLIVASLMAYFAIG